MADEILVERRTDQILVISLNRPRARNAVNAETARQMAEIVSMSERDDLVRAVILTSSSPEIFCAGGDLKEIAAGQAYRLGTPDGGFAGFVKVARNKPWIAAIAGKAVGGGLELGLACDMIVAGENASFALPEVLRGVYAGGGGVFRLARAIPRAIALELLATGLPINAQRAHALGLVNRVVPTNNVLGEAIALAMCIVKAAPAAVRETLALARIANQTTEAELWELSGQIGKRLAETEDFKEGPRAFAEKRAPVWKSS